MTHNKKILVIGSYPITQPRHGGQKRVEAVVSEYQKQFKDVRYVAVFSRWANPVHVRTDIPVSHQTDAVIMESRELEDIITGDAIFSDPSVKRAVTRLLTSYRPDIIQLEQAYPYLGLKPLLAELGLSPTIIFDAHNVESVMKQEMYEQTGYDEADARVVTQRIAEVERELAQRADLVVAVSQSDAAAYRKMGAKDVLLAHNGIYSSYPAPLDEGYWIDTFAKAQIDKKVLYVSSAHIPNWISFQAMVGEGLGFLAPDSRILLAGGLSDYLTQVYRWPQTAAAATFWLRAEPVGRLSEERLAALISVSDVVILPITSGGGSNLKTAEALLSGKPVVGTSYAFRSFEAFTDLPGVTVADTPEAFRAGILAALQAGPVTRSPEQQAAVQAVTWPHCLEALIQKVGTL